MQERVNVRNDKGLRAADLVVQWHPDQMMVGLGMELPDDIPNRHFVDAVYGNVPCQTKIGKIFFQRRRQDFPENIDFQTSDQEAEFFNQLGRDILDAVTGSELSDGLWTWMDRPHINRLIRLLRKARDAAFGRDE